MSQRCRRTGTAGSSTTARRSRRATSMSSLRWFATSPSGSGRRAFPQARSRCTRVPRRSSRRSSCTPSTRTRTARRPTWTSCWRNASAPQRRPPNQARPSASAVIAAAGSGQRLGAGGPKAFVEIAGRPMLEWSLDAFRAASTIAEIVVATPPDQDERVAEQGVIAVAGGEHRSESVSNALELCGGEIVVVHDAARPLVTPELVDVMVEELAAAENAAAVIAATPVTDTIKQVGDEGQVERTLDRSGLWAIQTPQVFRADRLREALADPDALPAASDDATLVERQGGRVVIHSTSPDNIKVTTPSDLRVAELLLRERG